MLAPHPTGTRGPHSADPPGGPLRAAGAAPDRNSSAQSGGHRRGPRLAGTRPRHRALQAAFGRPPRTALRAATGLTPGAPRTALRAAIGLAPQAAAGRAQLAFVGQRFYLCLGCKHVQAQALVRELEVIKRMRKAGELSPDRAKALRNDVYIQQMALD